MSGSNSGGENGAITSTLNSASISSALGRVVTFAVFVCLAKWMFGYPKIMQKAFKRSEMAAASDEEIQDDT
jgi:hypothetical protein